MRAWSMEVNKPHPSILKKYDLVTGKIFDKKIKKSIRQQNPISIYRD